MLIEKFDSNAMDEHRSLAAAASGPAVGNYFSYSKAANFDEQEIQNQIMPSYYRLANQSVVSRPSASSRTGQLIVAVNEDDADDAGRPSMLIKM